MSSSNETPNIMNVREIIEYAFGEFEGNTVNFKLVQTVLFLIARQLRLLERRVQVELGLLTLKPTESTLSVTEVKIHAIQKKKRKTKDDRSKAGDTGETDGVKKKKADKGTDKYSSDKTSSEKTSSDKTSTEKSSKTTSSDKTSTDKTPSTKTTSSEKDKSSKSSSGKSGERTAPDAADITSKRQTPTQKKRADSFEEATKSPTPMASVDSVGTQHEKILVVKRILSREAEVDEYVHGQKRTPQVSVVTQEQFERLVEAVRQLERKLLPIGTPGFPEHAELMEELRRGASLTNAMAALQLSARLEATEKALSKMIGMVTDLARQTPNLELNSEIKALLESSGVPFDTGAAWQKMGGAPGTTKSHEPTKSVPRSAEGGYGPAGGGPGSAGGGYGPAGGGYGPAGGGPGLAEGGYGPAGGGYGPTGVGPGSAGGGHGPTGGGYGPAGGGSVPAGGGSVPARGGSVPAGGGSVPARGGSVPAGGGSVPAGGGTVPAGGGSVPAGGGSVPAGGGSVPAGGGSVPAGGGSVPAGGGYVPAGGGYGPGEGGPGPTGAGYGPAGGGSGPAGSGKGPAGGGPGSDGGGYGPAGGGYGPTGGGPSPAGGGHGPTGAGYGPTGGGYGPAGGGPGPDRGGYGPAGGGYGPTSGGPDLTGGGYGPAGGGYEPAGGGPDSDGGGPGSDRGGPGPAGVSLGPAGGGHGPAGSGKGPAGSDYSTTRGGQGPPESGHGSSGTDYDKSGTDHGAPSGDEGGRGRTGRRTSGHLTPGGSRKGGKSGTSTGISRKSEDTSRKSGTGTGIDTTLGITAATGTQTSKKAKDQVSMPPLPPLEISDETSEVTPATPGDVSEETAPEYAVKPEYINQYQLAAASKKLYDNLMTTLRTITNRTTATAEEAHKLSISLDAKVQQALITGSRMTDLENLVKQYADQINVLDTGLSSQMTNYQEQLTQMQHDLEIGLDTMAEVLGNAGGDTVAITELNSNFTSLQEDFDHMLSRQKDLKDTQDVMSIDLEQLWKEIEVLRDIKSDREEVADALRDKAGISELNGLVSLLQFDAVRADFGKCIGAAYDKFNNQEVIWQKVIDDLIRLLNEKADIAQVECLKNDVEKFLNIMKQRIQTIVDIVGDPKSAMLSKKLFRNTACLSCGSPAHMDKEEPVLVPKLAKLYLAGARQPAEGAEAEVKSKAGGDYGICYKDSSIPHPIDPRSHVCKRYCGGSHTVLTEGPSRAPPGLVIQQVLKPINVEPGTDGKMYLVDAQTEKIPCLPCNLPKTKTPKLEDVEGLPKITQAIENENENTSLTPPAHDITPTN